jgi:YD repeat-containing protein
LLEATLPAGNRLQFSHDTASPNRGSHGNLLQVHAIADNPGTGLGRGDGHGGSITDRVWSFTYEPLFNWLASSTDPRGNDSGFTPPNGGTTSPGRYRTRWTYDYQEGDPGLNGINALASRFGVDLGTTPLNLGDRNGDGITLQASGNPVKIERPVVNLDPSSNQAGIEGDTTQEVVTLLEWNTFGQPTAIVDPEGNRHRFEYYPEADPDGDGTPTPTPPDGRTLDGTTGGYLKSRLLDTISAPGRNNGTDPTPAMIRHDFDYDDVGNLTGVINGRGVLTRFVVNQLNQVVEVRRGAATADTSGPGGDSPTGRGETGLIPFGFRTRYEYDANDNLVKREVEDIGETRGLGLYIEMNWTYDLLDNQVEVSREATATANLITRYRYDANENLIRVTQPEGNAHEWDYDERDLLLARTRGASGPRGGTPSVLQYDYDANGNLSRITDALEGLIDLEYDGFDRLARRIDQVGNTLDLFFDPVSNVVRLLRRGPPGGPTPTDRSGSSNVDLADTHFCSSPAESPRRGLRFSTRVL